MYIRHEAMSQEHTSDMKSKTCYIIDLYTLTGGGYKQIKDNFQIKIFLLTINVSLKIEISKK